MKLLLLALAASMLLAGCVGSTSTQATPTPSVVPTASASPTLTAAPSNTPSPDAAVFCEGMTQHSTETGRASFLADCKAYYGKSCASNSECGAFPCVESQCLIQPCNADAKCPNQLCGLHITRVPGFCTTQDVE